MKSILKSLVLFLMVALGSLPVPALTPFYYQAYNSDGTPQTNLIYMSAWPPAMNTFTSYGTNIIFGGNVIILRPSASGYVSNAAYPNTYRCFVTNANQSFTVKLPDTTNFTSLAYCIQASTTSLGDQSTYAMVTNWLGYAPVRPTYAAVTAAMNFTPATNGGPIANSQLPYTPAPNTFSGIIGALGYTPSTNTYAGLTAALGFAAATNGGPIATSQLGFAPATNAAPISYLQVTNALAFVPVPNTYAGVSNALGFRVATNGGPLTSAQITTALGYTPDIAGSVNYTNITNALGGVPVLAFTGWNSNLTVLAVQSSVTYTQILRITNGIIFAP
jgi:hypothetical protein